MPSGLKLWGIMTASAIVLSDDSPTLVKAAARLAKVVFHDRIQVCDGVDDHIQVQTALNALPAVGGTIVFLEGIFNLSVQVLRAIDNVTIRGQGLATRLNLDGATRVISAGAQSGWRFIDFDTDDGWVEIFNAIRPIVQRVTANGATVVEACPRECNLYIYRSYFGTGRYYAIDGNSGEITFQNDNCVDLIEAALETVWTNQLVVAGGSPGYYLNKTLTIDGKQNADPAQADRGLYEVHLDFSQIEFVMSAGAGLNRDNIVLESMHGCDLKFGIIVADPDAGFAALKIAPSILLQYAGGAQWSVNTLAINMISDVGSTGIGLEIDATNGNAIRNRFEILSIASYQQCIVIIDPQPQVASLNWFRLGYLSADMANGICVDLQGGNMASSYWEIMYLSALGGTAGINSPWADGNTFILLFIDADAGEAIIFGATSNENIVYGGRTLVSIGYTDGGVGNRFIAPGLSSYFTADAFQYPNPGTDWTPQLEGAHLGANLAAKKVWIPLNFLKHTDSIVAYRLVGDATEAAALTLDCKLVRVNKADPLTTSDIAGGDIVQVDAGGNFDSLATLTAEEVVVTDKQYVLEILGTTGAGDSITVMGVEVIVKRFI